jgi:hypothetical protein
MDSTAYAAERGKGLGNSVIRGPRKDHANQFRRAIKQLSETTFVTRMNNPLWPLAEILFRDEERMLRTTGHNELDFVPLAEGPYLRWPTENLSSENLAADIAASYPDKFRLGRSDPWTTFMDDNLNIIKMLRMKSSSQRRVGAPFMRLIHP